MGVSQRRTMELGRTASLRGALQTVGTVTSLILDDDEASRWSRE